jgi:hypothetical protein
MHMRHASTNNLKSKKCIQTFLGRSVCVRLMHAHQHSGAHSVNMATSVLERTRQLHEDIDRREQALVALLDAPPKSVWLLHEEAFWHCVMVVLE